MAGQICLCQYDLYSAWQCEAVPVAIEMAREA